MLHAPRLREKVTCMMENKKHKTIKLLSGAVLQGLVTDIAITDAKS